MGEAENELVHNAVRSNCAADELQFRIVRVIEDEVIEVKFAQVGAPNTTGNLLSSQS